ncbi:MAG: UDP-N-acetylmuramoyl-tripeptide--D-alanyl-D-alanine ligase [Clostridiales bacterium]|nr:UDP-N-acetylmuramoyl-tripeptide--D-alanyl-D-alanine ligase [Clostridiales bacterium]
MKMNAVKATEIMNGLAKNMSDELVFTGVSTDTRSIIKGDMFVAIKGENFDGAEYIEKAFEKGASCALTSKKSSDPRIISVEDSVIALGLLAKHNRDSHDIPVIAVTGSVGKTTVKNMLISVFSQKYAVHSTSGNKNNHIGLPMTLMSLDESHDVSILEMGMSDFGEIDYLSYIASPDYALITNIGMSHIGILGSQKNILKAKSEVMNHMKLGGIVLINGDDLLLGSITIPEGLILKKFGTVPENNYTAIEIGENQDGNCTFISDGTKFELPLPGIHNAVNAMGVVAIARIFKIEENLIKNGLLKFKQSKMRMHRFEKDGINYINDAYNANPQSMKAALDILLTEKGRKIAVLGDMLEMGNFSGPEHIRIGSYAAKIADILIVCGSEAENMKKGALSVGLDCSVSMFKDSKEAAEYLQKIITEGDSVLVKGSRGMKMENVLEYTVDGGKK